MATDQRVVIEIMRTDAPFAARILGPDEAVGASINSSKNVGHQVE